MSSFTKIKVWAVLAILVMGLSSQAFALTGKEAMNKTGKGIATSFKAVGGLFKGVGAGVYEVGEYLVVEITRPVRAITSKMVDWFGVDVEE